MVRRNTDLKGCFLHNGNASGALPVNEHKRVISMTKPILPRSQMT
jgi:hypothetical protein